MRKSGVKIYVVQLGNAIRGKYSSIFGRVAWHLRCTFQSFLLTANGTPDPLLRSP